MLENLKTLRAESGISQRQLADTVGVSQQSINKYENHNVEPDIETLCRLADFFHTSVDYITGYSTERWPVRTARQQSLTNREAQFLTSLRMLNPQQQSCILQIMDCFLKTAAPDGDV